MAGIIQHMKQLVIRFIRPSRANIVMMLAITGLTLLYCSDDLLRFTGLKCLLVLDISSLDLSLPLMIAHSYERGLPLGWIQKNIEGFSGFESYRVLYINLLVDLVC